MKKNVGTLDRGLRIIGGLALLSLAATGSMWGLIGIVPLLTGILGWCPPYQLFGVSTAHCCSEKECKM
ncbi:MAG: DUF2892 domain-containing protein [Geobacteraceae bacterium]|nr:DUF2892 domain-containing protein [Geobacteraceae bacterium]